VRRFWDGTPDEHGTLIHRRDGTWAFWYEPGDDDDEPIFRFDKHLFVVGEYVTVTEHDGVARPFRHCYYAGARNSPMRDAVVSRPLRSRIEVGLARRGRHQGV